MFPHGIDQLTPGSVLGVGTVFALSRDGVRERWRFTVPFSPLAGGLALANRMLFFQSPTEESPPLGASPRWAFYALDADTGQLLKRIEFEGRALTSPAVSRGRIYWASVTPH